MTNRTNMMKPENIEAAKLAALASFYEEATKARAAAEAKAAEAKARAEEARREARAAEEEARAAREAAEAAIP